MLSPPALAFETPPTGSKRLLDAQRSKDTISIDFRSWQAANIIYVYIITYTVTVLNSIHIYSTYIIIYIYRCVCVSLSGMSSRSMISLLTFVAVLRCLLRSRMRRWISCSSVWSRTGNCFRLAGCLAIRHIPPVCWFLVHCVTTEKIDVPQALGDKQSHFGWPGGVNWLIEIEGVHRRIFDKWTSGFDL